jgi:hypothetical protein
MLVESLLPGEKGYIYLRRDDGLDVNHTARYFCTVVLVKNSEIKSVIFITIAIIAVQIFFLTSPHCGKSGSSKLIANHCANNSRRMDRYFMGCGIRSCP